MPMMRNALQRHNQSRWRPTDSPWKLRTSSLRTSQASTTIPVPRCHGDVPVAEVEQPFSRQCRTSKLQCSPLRWVELPEVMTNQKGTKYTKNHPDALTIADGRKMLLMEGTNAKGAFKGWVDPKDPGRLLRTTTKRRRGGLVKRLSQRRRRGASAGVPPRPLLFAQS